MDPKEREEEEGAREGRGGRGGAQGGEGEVIRIKSKSLLCWNGVGRTGVDFDIAQFFPYCTPTLR
jgi:hypothetical protein